MSWMGTGLLEFGVRDALKAARMLPGDKMTDPASQTVVLQPKETEAMWKEKAEEEHLRKVLESLPEPLSVISYTLLHSLHPDKQGHIPVLELTELMRKISDNQAQWFAANNGLEYFKQLRPCLLFAVQYPRVLQPDGDSIDRETVHALQATAIVLPAAILSETLQLRLREEIVRNQPQIASWLHVEEYNAEKRKWELLFSIPLSFCREILAQQ